MSKALVVLSGGQDSTTCLYWAKNRFPEVHAVTFDYNQRHRREINAAIRIGEMVGVRSHEVVELGPILKGASPLTDPDKPLEQYENFAQMDKTIGSRVELTFVPMRNALFLTLAANRAVVLGAGHIVTGVCQADNANYPDCRDAFLRSFSDTAASALGHDLTGEKLMLHAPLMMLTKAESISRALQLPGCYAALAYSHTAYDGAFPPTGHDHATMLRAHGFEEADVPDPLVLRCWTLGMMDLPPTPNYREQILGRYLALANITRV